ncbi:HAMP domain-containing sensor histidine kinase [Carboxylicivirga linearis]|uniref:histidine kinase n=1 Tax=Carboxylicivirga linearis TaxID=1628157 RepID=A0ABS5JYJ1_9BACT|nr:sensor histidine kinase [Carboxylicivirga linearis]MBS2099953.1 sensor histidine kinase [Carboxylicivirga linearis]
MINLKLRHIRTNLAITIGAFVFLTIMVLGWVHYFSVSRSLMKDAYEKQLITTLRAYQSSLQALLERAIETSEILADDPILIEWFESPEPNDQLKELALERLNKLKEQFGYTTVFAVSKKTHEYWRENFKLLDIVSKDDPDDSWFFDAIISKQKSALNFDYNKELNETILFVNVLMGDINNPIGVAGIGIDPSILVDKFKKNKSSDNAVLWLIDQSGKIIMSEDSLEINQQLSNCLGEETVKNIVKSNNHSYVQHIILADTKYELASMNVGTTKYKVVMIIPQKDLLSVLDVIRSNTVWLSIIILLLTLVVVSIVANRITHPIIRLTGIANQLWQNQLHTKIDQNLISRTDEIGHLAQSFQNMQTQLSDVIDKLNQANFDLKSEKKELKRTNSKLEIALEKASKSERLTKSFLANISHEIRTPMNSIMGFAQLIEVEDLADPVLNTYSNIIVRNSQQLLSILNNLIEVSKMDSGMTKPNISSLSAMQLVTGTFDLFSYASGEKIIIYNESEKANSDILFDSDPLLIQQVLNNLLSNAIKYTPSGIIKIGFKKEDHQVIFYVSDTGIGVSESDAQSVFEPFWQVDQSNTINDGAGLGLAISKRIADILNGKLWLESKPNEGSVFYFSLPTG